MSDSESQITHPTSAVEVIPSSALESIERGTIDVQISTAHKFPRSMTQFKQRAVSMATLDEETAASCLYSRPVGGGKFAEGLSVRMAEIVGASYGNLRVGAMIVEVGERRVVARGFAHDLETNFAVQTEVVESCVKRDGTPYDERMRIVIAKSALAKARRDATFQVVPKALCKPVESAVKLLLQGDGTAMTIATRRKNVMVWLNGLGIDLARVYKALDIGGEDDIQLPQLEMLLGLRTAIKEGDSSVDETFPPIMKIGRVGVTAENPLEEKAPAKEPATTPAPAAEKPKPKMRKPDNAPPDRAAAPVVEAEVVSEETKQPAAEPVAAAEPTPEPAATAKPPMVEAAELRDALLAKLKESGVTRSRLPSVLVEMDYIQDEVGFVDLPVKVMKAALENWDDVKAAIFA